MTSHLVAFAVMAVTLAAAAEQPGAKQAPLPSGDPAVDGYTMFVEGKQLKVPVDLTFVMAALDRLLSALRRLGAA